MIKLLSVFALSATGLLISSCSNNSIKPLKNGSLSISLIQKNRSNGKISDASTPAFILISIKDSHGNFVFDSKEFYLYSFGQSYITEQIQLSTAEYSVTQFLVLDNSHKVIYATPAEGSDLAKYINDPLPVNFSISENGTTMINPEVIAVNDIDDPQSFGYASFGFNIIQITKRIKQICLSNPNYPTYLDTVNYFYDSDNRLTDIESSGINRKYYYDINGKISKINHSQDGAIVMVMTYQYDNAGQISSVLYSGANNSFIRKETFTYQSGILVSVDSKPGSLSFHEIKNITYDSKQNPVSIIINGYDSNDELNWVTSEQYTFDNLRPVSNEIQTDLFVGLTYILADDLNRFKGIVLKHNVTKLSTTTKWVSDEISTQTVIVSSILQYDSFGYPVKETISSATAAFYPLNGSIKSYTYY